MSRRFRLLVTAVIGVAYPVLLVAALLPAPAVFTVVLAAVLAIEVRLALRWPFALPVVLTEQLSVGFRIVSADVLAAVLAARVVDHRAVTLLTLLAVFALLGARDVVALLDRRIAWLRAGGPVSWRNLTVPGFPTPKPRLEDRALDWQATVPSMLLPIGATLAELFRSFVPLLVAAIVLLVGVVVLLAVRVLAWRRAARPGPAATRLALRAAIADLAPEVVLHHSGRRRTTDQAEMWVPSLRGLTQRTMILVREPSHLEALEHCGLPVVFAPASTDVELLSVESVGLVLYPTNTANINNHQIRVPGIFDVMVGAGDSDEPHNSSPMSRIFDEVWVAGPLGRARYAPAVTGVHPGHVREVGVLPIGARPGGDALRPTSSLRARTVLYAPSWESTQDRANLSSLTSAVRILTGLLAMTDVRVLYAPPPAAGSRLPEFADFDAEARALVERRGRPHEVVDRARATAESAHAALIITDVSPVIADALALDVPYAVPLRPDWTEDRMRSAYPTLAGGAVFDPAAGVSGAFADPAARAVARRALAHELFGRGVSPLDTAAFQRRFQTAVDEALAQQATRRSYERPTVAG